MSGGDTDRVANWAALLGYLDFSEGKPDARFQKQLNDAYALLEEQGAAEPWTELHAGLRRQLSALHNAASGPLRDAVQAEAVVALAFEQVLPAYRRHDADLLRHRSDPDLWQPFFLARVFEAVLRQGPPWDDQPRIVQGALVQLNDYVGYRPVAILETRPRGEPYEHERVRPIPLYLRGAGAACGRYRELIEQTLALLKAADPSILADAGFDPELLDELALDPRAYDFSHPVQRRPNYVFGEWDPHHLDNQGRYRRFVVRPVTLDGLLERVTQTPNRDRGELMYEAAAALAGTILMASGVTGGSPGAMDSFTTVDELMRRIARYRDAFYQQLLKALGGDHGTRLRQECTATRQPFGAVRQHLNQHRAEQSALQLQQRHLALLFAAMGYPEASRDHASRIPTASIRLLSEIHGRLTTGQLLAGRGERARAAQLLPEIEDLLRRGIACGAIVDPWNILGFQGLFPLFASQRDSTQDQRVDELIQVVAALFNLYTRLMGEAAGHGEADLVQSLGPALRRLADWWDQFASVEVGDVREVHGGEAVASAEQVAQALAGWHALGHDEPTGLAFWKKHLDNCRSSKAFALIIDTLLRQEEYPAAMGLLMTWLGQAEQVPLQEGEYSFHELALRWMLSVTGGRTGEPAIRSADERRTLVKKFFAYLEANADEYWHTPELEESAPEQLHMPEEGSLYDAAYEEVTYQDSTDDSEGAVSEGPASEGEFLLELEGERLQIRLRFVSTVARLWQIAVWKEDAGEREEIEEWRSTARRHQEKLLRLIDALHAYPVPTPLGSYDSLVEYDQRRVLKEELLYQAINTCLDAFLAEGTLRGKLGEASVAQPAAATLLSPSWGAEALALEQALLRSDAAAARAVLPDFVRRFGSEPLLFTALADGGDPRHILRVRLAQTMLRSLLANLPRLGLLRETYQLLKTARNMEQVDRPRGRSITQFNELFQSAFQAVVEAVVEAAPAWAPPSVPSERPLAELLEQLSAPFVKLWIDHGRTMYVSILETVRGEEAWGRLRDFVRRYGGDVFDARFMNPSNLQGILHRGVAAYFDYLRDNPDPLRPVRLVEELDRGIPREEAERVFELILRAVVENQEEYHDYKSTVSQSDYGENVHLLLEFLRIKARYERHAWHLRPLFWIHEVLVRKGQFGTAELWHKAFTDYNRAMAEQFVHELAALEQLHGLRLRTVTDRVHERFVKPLDLDRLCALVRPAMDEAVHEERRSFARLEQELQPYLANPQGVGLDVPHWLERLEQAVQRVWVARSSLALLAGSAFQVPRVLLSFDDLQQQLRDWEKPLIPHETPDEKPS